MKGLLIGIKYSNLIKMQEINNILGKMKTNMQSKIAIQSTMFKLALAILKIVLMTFQMTHLRGKGCQFDKQCVPVNGRGSVNILQLRSLERACLEFRFGGIFSRSCN